MTIKFLMNEAHGIFAILSQLKTDHFENFGQMEAAGVALGKIRPKVEKFSDRLNDMQEEMAELRADMSDRDTESRKAADIKLIKELNDEKKRLHGEVKELDKKYMAVMDGDGKKEVEFDFEQSEIVELRKIYDKHHKLFIKNYEIASNIWRKLKDAPVILGGDKKKPTAT